MSDDSEDRQRKCPGATGWRGVTLESTTRAARYSSQRPPEVHGSIISCFMCLLGMGRGDRHTANMSCPHTQRTEWEGTVEIMHFNYVDTQRNKKRNPVYIMTMYGTLDISRSFFHSSLDLMMLSHSVTESIVSFM